MAGREVAVPAPAAAPSGPFRLRRSAGRHCVLARRVPADQLAQGLGRVHAAVWSSKRAPAPFTGGRLERRRPRGRPDRVGSLGSGGRGPTPRPRSSRRPRAPDSRSPGRRRRRSPRPSFPNARTGVVGVVGGCGEARRYQKGRADVVEDGTARRRTSGRNPVAEPRPGPAGPRARSRTARGEWVVRPRPHRLARRRLTERCGFAGAATTVTRRVGHGKGAFHDAPDRVGTVGRSPWDRTGRPDGPARRRRRTWWVAVAATVVALAVVPFVAAALSGPAPGPPRPPAPLTYAALGDSYASGALIPTELADPAGCVRSTSSTIPTSWPPPCTWSSPT